MRCFFTTHGSISRLAAIKTFTLRWKRKGPPPRVPQIRETASPECRPYPKALVTQLSFSHLTELIAIEDDTKRAFYEVECVAGNWSVRELKRQIASLYYERSGLSTNKAALGRCGPSLAPRFYIKFLMRPTPHDRPTQVCSAAMAAVASFPPPVLPQPRPARPAPPSCSRCPAHLPRSSGLPT
ncbi:MAG: DUF1016 family protein [Chitinivibrionales bacterium]|nr:DUF1016 family protein [Chitinivibrionales bacterium]